MKLTILLFVFASLAFGQAAGTVTVATTITAVAGSGTAALTCVATPGDASGISTMRVVCTVGTQTILSSDSTVPSTPGTGIIVSASSGSNIISWQLNKGITPLPDGWSVAANAVTKAGTF